jgi:hypothetical protein
MSKELIAEKSLQLAIMDVIENGMPLEKVKEYITSDACFKAANRYVKLFEKQF